jgi:hypothetical protein
MVFTLCCVLFSRRHNLQSFIFVSSFILSLTHKKILFFSSCCILSLSTNPLTISFNSLSKITFVFTELWNVMVCKKNEREFKLIFNFYHPDNEIKQNFQNFMMMTMPCDGKSREILEKLFCCCQESFFIILILNCDVNTYSRNKTRR